MGIRLFNRCSLYVPPPTGRPSWKRSCSSYTPSASTEGSAPDPVTFKIIKTLQVGKHLVVKINYPHCTNYEGNKVCLFINTKKSEFLQRRRIDPYFAKTLQAPFARFKPTKLGWDAAKRLASII